MQTIDGYVVYSRTNVSRRFRGGRALGLTVLVAAIGMGAFVAGRATNTPQAAAPAKLDARVVPPTPDRAASDEARLAAFQQAVALSYVSKTAFAPVEEPRPIADPQARAHPRKPDPGPTKKAAALLAPVPPSRPVEPLAATIVAQAAPRPDPAPSGYMGAIGNFARSMERVPSRVGEFATGTSRSVLGAFSSARSRIGL
jgi:hypothetical protein